MKYTRMVGILGIAWLLAWSRLASASVGCTVDMAKVVEERLGAIESWASFVIFYKENRNCDSSALSYAFTQAIVKLAAQPKGVANLSIAVRKEPWLRHTVLQHLRSTAISKDEADMIIANTRESCPSAERRPSGICLQVQRALTK
jgi:hypothetical protein